MNEISEELLEKLENIYFKHIVHLDIAPCCKTCVSVGITFAREEIQKAGVKITKPDYLAEAKRLAFRANRFLDGSLMAKKCYQEAIENYEKYISSLSKDKSNGE